jgi:phospholipid transport system transporter-binding protein
MQAVMNSSIINQDNTLVLAGELNFTTVVSLWKASLPLLEKQTALRFDFSRVTSSNSAGVALMLEWIKYAKHVGKPIQFCDVPAKLLSIIVVSGIENMVEFS